MPYTSATHAALPRPIASFKYPPHWLAAELACTVGNPFNLTHLVYSINIFKTLKLPKDA